MVFTIIIRAKIELGGVCLQCHEQYNHVLMLYTSCSFRLLVLVTSFRLLVISY